MPIRRAAAAPPQDKGASAAPEEEPPEDSPTAVEDEEGGEAAMDSPVPAEDNVKVGASTETNGEGDGEGDGEVKKVQDAAPEGHARPTVANGEVKCQDCADGQCATHCFVLLLRMKDGVKLGKSKAKKWKKTIPPWASVAASKKIPAAASFARPQPRVDEVLLEAVKSSTCHSGMSYMSVLKYMTKKYPNLELDKKKYLIKKALKKYIEKGTIKQLKGKGLSGSFAATKQPPTKLASKKPALVVGGKNETLGDALPLIITRLCEPKEASYILIKKYMEQHFPHLRPDQLKAALIRAVDKGQLERITGKGASGTFQLKRTGDKVLLAGGPLEDAICSAVIAMNEPKTCSTATLRKFLRHANQDSSETRIVSLLRKTLTKCKMLGWMDQITGSGLSGTYRLAFPYYPSPAVLFPDRVIAPQKKKTLKLTTDTSDEESEREESEDEEDDDDDDDEPPPPKRSVTKRPAPKSRRPPPSKKPRGQSKARGKRPAPAKKPATPAKKKPAPAAAKKLSATAAKKAAVAKATPPAKAAPPAKAEPPAKAPPPVKAPPPAKATPVKRAAPTKRPKTPAVKKLGARSSKAATPIKSAAKKEVKTKPTTRKSLRGKK